MTDSNQKQVGGDHYKKLKIQPWDYALENDLGPLELLIIKYITRWRVKLGTKDLLKARHCIDKLMEYYTDHPEKLPENDYTRKIEDTPENRELLREALEKDPAWTTVTRDSAKQVTPEGGMIPCPFCSNKSYRIVRVYTDKMGFCVRCLSCGASGPDKPSEVEAVDAWAHWGMVNGNSLHNK